MLLLLWTGCTMIATQTMRLLPLLAVLVAQLSLVLAVDAGGPTCNLTACYMPSGCLRYALYFSV